MAELVAGLRRWPAGGDEDGVVDIAHHVVDMFIVEGFSDERLLRLPTLLAAVWRTWWLECEVLDGGYFQYFWNDGASQGDATAAAFDQLAAPRYAAVQRSAMSDFNAVAARINRLRAEGNGSYQAALAVQDFASQDDAYMAEHTKLPVVTLLARRLAQRSDEIVEALLATELFPGAT